MRAPRLSPRLAEAALLVGRTHCLVDVGCDHGKLAVFCLLTGQVERAVGVDVSAPSLAKADRLADRYGVDLVTRLGDGLLPTRAEEWGTVVIAGMGGMEICRILSAVDAAPPRLVLVPHHNSDTVVRYLTLAGYGVEHDYVVEDGGHWYRAILATGVKAFSLGADWQQRVEALSPMANWYVGADNAHRPAYADYRRHRLATLRRNLAAGSTRPEVEAEIQYLEQIDYVEDNG